MGLIELISLNRNSHESGGETMRLEIGETEVIIEYTNGAEKDIRIHDGEKIIKVRLDDDTTIRDVLKNDQHLTPV